MKIIPLILAAVSLAMAGCSSQPMPPYQTGDGGRGLNPGARAEASTGARYVRNVYYPTHGDLEDVYGRDYDRDRDRVYYREY
jgi:hypothetical protein